MCWRDVNLTAGLAEFGINYPNVQVHVRESDSPTKLQALKDGTIDPGITVESVGSAVPHDDLFTYESLLMTKVVAVLPVVHPLADRVSLSPADLADEPLILLGHDSTNVPAQVMPDLSELNVVLSAESMDFARRMVAKGVGVTTLPELGIDDVSHRS